MSDVLISTRHRGLAATLVLALGTFAVGTDAFVVAGFLPSMAESLHTTTAAAGQSVTVFAVAYAVLAPVLATATARVPRRTLLVAALAVLGIANIGSAIAPNLAVLIASRVLAAAGAAVYTPGAGAVSAALVPPELRGRALSVVVGGLTIATALGVPLGDVAGAWLGWRAALGLVAALCLLVGLGVYLIMPALPGGARVPLRNRLALLRRRSVLAVLPLTVLGMGASYTIYAFSVPALKAVGVAENATTLMLFLYGLGAVVGNFLSGYTTDRWGPTRILAVGYLSMALALALLGWFAWTGSTAQPVVAFLVLVWGASTWTQTPPQQTRLIDAAPSEASVVVSLNASAIYLGIGTGTLLGGLLITTSPTLVYAAATTIATLAAGYLFATRG
ncbi:MFS transporter [Saccharopolyspora sp. K220]|uniref:MFS transporter n=1 Tax=Saccharopolyspora soli TaxID=2926618 RepID=UPI001F59560A|nr:MFS transporter [Saccharopolyspora soli]MCI2419191.1 MFS transporter [Saccharopolyspora soli]